MHELVEKYLLIRWLVQAYQEGTLVYYIAAFLLLTILGFVFRRVFGTRVLKKISDYCFYAIFMLIGGFCIYFGIIALKAGVPFYQGGIPLILFIGIVLVLCPFYWSFINKLFNKISTIFDISGGKKDRDN